ncbi:hypothetical protein [Micromonospora rosaria]|uniref:hypothetical protein n=1 Tax=Micromonospora rosaria TaxID=47874 RepID=UPI000A7D872F|nr:hypothetical protein [Micromonospora rosaria]
MRDQRDERMADQARRSEKAEREAAKQRILDMAEAERIPVEETTRAVPVRRGRHGQR